MKIYTKTGDLGTTSTFAGERTLKTDPRIEAVGSVDELNSLIGIVLSTCTTQDGGDSDVRGLQVEEIKGYLLQIQHDLFSLGAEISLITHKDLTNVHAPHITEKHIEDLEKIIDFISEKLIEQKCFLLPNGTPLSCWLHFARTVTRRAERDILRLQEVYHLNPTSLRFMNRLSDLFYVLARYANKETMSEQQPMYKYFK